eukprot:15471922-Alexandrium_andersonii.AAC.1
MVRVVTVCVGLARFLGRVVLVGVGVGVGLGVGVGVCPGSFATTSIRVMIRGSWSIEPPRALARSCRRRSCVARLRAAAPQGMFHRGACALCSAS